MPESAALGALPPLRSVLEGRIGAVAARQHGVLTYRQLIEAGLSAAAVDRRLRSGRMRRLHRGVYLVIPFALPHTREMAAVLASGPGSVVSHGSAAAIWGVGEGRADGLVDVSVVTAHRGRHAGIRVHRTQGLQPGERTWKDGIPLTTPGRTLIDVASLWAGRRLEAAVARAERERLVTLEELRALLARRRRHPGVRALRAVLEVEGGPAFTRSEAEERFLALSRAARLPPPRCNVPIGAYELDFLWPAAGLAVEVDGYVHHATRRRFEGDRRKDAELAAKGISVIRLTWRQISEEPMATAAQLAQALARAERR